MRRVFIPAGISALATLALAQFTYNNDQTPLSHPQHPGPPVVTDNLTIYQVLNENPHFSRLAKVVNFTGGEVVDLLNDSSKSITFFALPNEAIHRRRRPRHERLEDELESYDLSSIVPIIEEVFGSLQAKPSDDDEKKKRFWRFVLRGVFAYHILPAAHTIESLVSNTTHATNLTIPFLLDGESQRISVKHTLLPPSVTVNVISKIWRRDIVASNGYIHAISRPLLPPPAIFQELFLATKHYSIFTSAIQRTGLTDALDLRWVPAKDAAQHKPKGSLEGARATTVFAPLNSAFEALPPKLRFFLFSPFGKKALEKLLAFHIVPDIVAYSDYFHNATSKVTVTADVNVLEGIQSHSVLDIGHDHFHRPSHAKCLMRQGPGWERGHMPPPPEHDGPFPCGRRDRKRSHPPVSPPPCEGRKDYPKHPKHPGPPPPGPPRFPGKLVSLQNITLPTLLANHTLEVHIAQVNMTLPIPTPPGRHAPSEIVTSVTVNGVPVVLPDIPAANGAVHVLSRLINPLRKTHPEDMTTTNIDEWEDWEEWLPQWAEEV